MAKSIALTVTVLMLTGCASMDQVVCFGTGTCGASGASYGGSARWTSPTPQSVITPQGTYQFVTNQSTGSIMSVVKTSDGK